MLSKPATMLLGLIYEKPLNAYEIIKLLIGIVQVSKQGGQNNMNFSEKLLILRKAKNLTQEQLAEKLNFKLSFYILANGDSLGF